MAAIYDGLDARRIALEHAVGLVRDGRAAPNEVVTLAVKFEAFLTGLPAAKPPVVTDELVENVARRLTVHASQTGRVTWRGL